MLNQKDKIILEHLFAYSRFTSKQLAKVTNLTQQAVHYRIKKLEERGYISRYDAIINWNSIPLIKEIYYLRVSNPKKFINDLFKEKSIFGINEVVGNYNLIIWCFFRSKNQRKEFQKKLKKLDWTSINVKDAIFPQTPIFNLPIKLSIPKEKERKIKLDKTDIKIMRYLSNGHARDSVKEIGDNLKISYDVVYYRLKKIIRSGFFFRLAAQVGFDSLDLKLSMLTIKLKKESKIENTVRSLKRLDFFNILLSDNKEKLHLHIFSKDIEDYWKKIDKIVLNIGEEIEDIKQFYIKNTPLLNRYPLEFLLKKHNS